ncbi:metalloregulator ArsR/SmtB family transcription factor [Mesorhizobium sp. LHD-90]|uniref:ArsR/SmtB family transcription factor n=1 Tax=Mesorhizobium sp. LHD-90 TaxID=3071414 RepID=UPI0027E015EF|nr:metalloregulator ArsR/SmtB family transcription factor [Mesorhizobium sp. LHD-90]MDQ6436812.1 metalloregulator ArsR/SmtB family transcription factor [Mesorhizobium sp. LHD-90]
MNGEQATATDAANLLTMLGNEKRLAILRSILDREMSVGALAEKVELSQSALSQHLAKLRKSKLVETRRDRQTIYYSCRSEKVRTIMRALHNLYQIA